MKWLLYLIITLVPFLNWPTTENDTPCAKGVLDRFEDNNLAVILVEEWNQELIIPKSQLPVGSKENMWYWVKGAPGWDRGTGHVVQIKK